MTELEEATQLLGRLVHHSLHNSFTAEVEATETPPAPALSVGQYL